jgi:hypothetical protein
MDSLANWQLSWLDDDAKISRGLVKSMRDLCDREVAGFKKAQKIIEGFISEEQG